MVDRPQGPLRYEVTIRLAAPRPIAPGEPQDVVELLDRTAPVTWREQTAADTDDGRGVQLRVVLVADDEAQARALVLDRVRGLVGLDYRYARWQVESPSVRPAPVLDDRDHHDHGSAPTAH